MLSTLQISSLPGRSHGSSQIGARSAERTWCAIVKWRTHVYVCAWKYEDYKLRDFEIISPDECEVDKMELVLVFSSVDYYTAMGYW